ncbi:MAG: hypothetical protein WCG20_03205 [bacterium]
MPHIEISYSIILVIWASYVLSGLVKLAKLYFEKKATIAPIASLSGRHRSAGLLLRVLAKKYQFNAIFIGRKEAAYQEATAYFTYSENSVSLLGDYYKNMDAQKTFIVFHEFGHVLFQHYLWRLIEDPCRSWFTFITQDGSNKFFFLFFINAGSFGMPLISILSLLTFINIPILIVFIDEIIASTLGTIAMYRHCNLSRKQLFASSAFYTFALSTYVESLNKVYQTGFVLYFATILFKQVLQQLNLFT